MKLRFRSPSPSQFVYSTRQSTTAVPAKWKFLLSLAYEVELQRRRNYMAPTPQLVLAASLDFADEFDRNSKLLT